MPTHVHTGGIQFLIDGLVILLWLFLFRVIELKMHNNAVGKAFAFIH